MTEKEFLIWNLNCTEGDMLLFIVILKDPNCWLLDSFGIVIVNQWYIICNNVEHPVFFFSQHILLLAYGPIIHSSNNGFGIRIVYIVSNLYHYEHLIQCMFRSLIGMQINTTPITLVVAESRMFWFQSEMRVVYLIHR